MQLPKPVGRDAAVRKYDILSALMAHALSRDKTCQRQVLRLMALITTRYNWKRDELTMGQDEIARLWQVDTRTVKREMSRLRASGWLVMKRQGARGRVSVYSLDLDKIFLDTRETWINIGPDFVERVQAEDTPEGPAGNVVPLRPVAPPREDGSLWSDAQARLYTEYPACFAAWFSGLSEVCIEEGCVVLQAQTRFHASYVMTQYEDRLVRLLRNLDPSIRAIRVEV